MTGLAAPPDPGEVSHDQLLDGAVQLYQPARGYRAAIDPVLVAAATPVAAMGLDWDADTPSGGTPRPAANDDDDNGNRPPARTVLDLGCGVGAISLCLLARVAGLEATGIEIQPALAALARQNAAANGMAGRLTVIEGDAAAAPGEVSRAHFDLVVMNPPFAERGATTAPPDDSRATAHVEGVAVLDDWIAAARRHLKPRGWLTLIHRADRFPDVVAALADGFGSISLLPVHAREGEPAGRILVRARKSGRSPARLLGGLVAHRDDGRYTPEVDHILRGTVDLSARFDARP